MKHLLILAFITSFTCKASAQNEKVIDASKVALPIGKWITVRDSVYDYKVTAEATIVYLGGQYPHQRLALVLKGDAIAPVEFFKGKVVIASGTVLQEGGKAVMTITDEQYFLVRKTDTTGGRVESYIVSPAKPPITAKEAVKLVGKQVHVCDTVYNYKTIGSSLALLYVGSKASNSNLMVVLKNMNPNVDLKKLLNLNFDFYGKVIFYKRKLAVIIPDFGYRSTL